MTRGLEWFGLFLIVLAMSACTSMGLHDAGVRRHIDFGPPDTVSLCVLTDQGITEQEAREVIREAWNDEGRMYGLEITVASVRPWRRPGFTMEGIVESLLDEPLRSGCDRLFALVGRNLGDFVWGLVGLPEVLGAVNDETLTHGYAVVRFASLNQVFMSPVSVVRHEIYHLLGCGEHFDMRACYERIATMKRWKREHQADFFPSWDLVNRRMLVSREAVNARLNEVSGASASALAASAR